MRIPISFSFMDRLAYCFSLGLLVCLPFSPALSEIFSVSFLVTWLITQFSPDYRKFWKKIPFWLWAVLAGLMIWGLAVSAFSRFPLNALAGCVTKWGEWMFLAIAAVSVLSTPKRVDTFLKVAILSSLVIVLDGFWQYFFGWDLLRHRELLHGFYPLASFTYYTRFASYIAVFFILGIGMNLNSGLPRTERWILFVHHALFFVMLILTFSRGAWLAASAGFAALTFFREKRLLVIASLGLLSFLLFTPADLMFRFGINWGGEADGYRRDIWYASLDMIRSHLWTGVGINNFLREFAPRFFGESVYAHNSFIQFAAETGVPGLALLLTWFFGVLGWSFSELRKTNSRFTSAGFGLVFALGAFLIHSLVDSLFFNSSLAAIFWLLLGALLGLVIVNRETEIRPRESQRVRVEARVG